MPEIGMYEAVENNNIEAVRKYYTENPGYLDETDDGGYTILMEAAKKGRHEIVQCLVELGADINSDCEIIDHYSDQRGTAITFALENFHRDVAIYLIQKGADTETAYYYREDEQTPYSEPTVHSTCFMYAMDRLDVELLELMVQHGLDVNDSCNACDSNNRNLPPLFYAIKKANPDMVQWLIQKGADPKLKHAVAVRYYDDEILTINALIYAVNRYLAVGKADGKSFQIIQQLLEAGVDLSCTIEYCSDSVLDLIINYNYEDKQLIRLFGLQNILEKIPNEEERADENYIPKCFEISIGSEVTPTFKVTLTDDMLIWEEFYPENVLLRSERLPLNNGDWGQFWILCDMAGIWYWGNGSYAGPKTPEGRQWKIEIGYRDRGVTVSGYNAFPFDEEYPECEGYTPLFRKFLRAVKELLHGLPFE